MRRSEEGELNKVRAGRRITIEWGLMLRKMRFPTSVDQGRQELPMDIISLPIKFAMVSVEV